jgi:hypothetical protein
MAYYLLLKEFDTKFFSPAQDDNFSIDPLLAVRLWSGIVRAGVRRF